MIRSLLLILFCTTLYPVSAQYTMPEEIGPHEGTWLQWPHNHLYGPFYRDDLEPTWIEMTRELVAGENVHIIAYDSVEYNHIVTALTNAGVPLTNVDFFIHENDDCWIRDNGPIFVFDDNDYLHLLDWGFNGWGNSTPYSLCDVIPESVANDLGTTAIDLSAMVLEGGAIEIDGNGTLMATRSSIVNSNRNPGLTESQIESYMTTYLGVSNFLWLDGVAGLEITDMHIDGFAKFHDSTTIVCMDSLDLIYWQVPPADITTLYTAQNASGNSYNYVYLPLTQNDVETTWGQDLGYKGSYVNYYIGNAAVLVPTYNDPNDATAISILQTLYPTRTVVGIDVRNLYYGGGMIHCVTQQQPYSANPIGITESTNTAELFEATPNPATDMATISFSLEQTANVQLTLHNSVGQLIQVLQDEQLAPGEHSYELNTTQLPAGTYTYTLTTDGEAISKKLNVIK